MTQLSLPWWLSGLGTEDAVPGSVRVSLLLTTGADSRMALAWIRGLLDSRHSYFLGVQDTDNQEMDWESLKSRFLCHFLVEALSPRGLDELCENLFHLIEFYRDESVETQTSPVKQVVGRVVRRYERPSFSVDEE